ncbi:hypothetical protein DVF84_25725 [Salmonella enterica subsp. enterica serovar Typhimurium]|uniref:hypothetical protein n=1 Tax=Enterobacter cloacae TaxID=550 RepID=UPI000907E639|nr:hypothetical protein [Enterobacter cloacae]AXQ32225.1 hypothetical protein D0Z05_02085 [Enterobacter hormaechei]EBA2639901.1 hypothetical protein [Salmonella enterica subsp. enterica serovar Typhimurium]QGJ43804.1 hypothetical protein E4179_26485 [Citrobacter freundii]RFC06926.1 hypothetical protein DDJ38_30180 [Klebsiella pneumoniae]EBY3043886.1 hypothetical protein [Salmonella enterica subsp. enterica serovar Typhimurium]
MGSCAAPSAKGDDKFITTDYLQQCHRRPGRICFRISAIHPLIITYSGVATRRLRAPITALKKLRPALPLIAVLL